MVANLPQAFGPVACRIFHIHVKGCQMLQFRAEDGLCFSKTPTVHKFKPINSPQYSINYLNLHNSSLDKIKDY